MTVYDINGNLTSDSTNVSIINFNSPNKLKISEIMIKTSDPYSTYGNASYFQWLEVYNPSENDIDFSNFKIRKISYKSGGYWDITNKSPISIKSKGYAIFCATKSAVLTFFPDCTNNDILFVENLIGEQKDDAYFTSSDTPIFLLDSNDKICDGLIYKDSWVPEEQNISMERKDYNTPAYLKDNWGECVNLEYWNYGAKGTPGKENSITKKSSDAELKISVSLNKKVFSPKENEFLEITYSLSEYATVTIKVFNSSGSEIIEILKHQSSGTEERTVRFYGKDSDNKTLTAGIYIIYIEALNSETGKTATKAVSFVIGNKM